MKNISLIVILLAYLPSCRLFDKPAEPAETLPPVTQSGTGVFACYEGGRLFRVKDEGGSGSSWNREFISFGRYGSSFGVFRTDLHIVAGDKGVPPGRMMQLSIGICKDARLGTHPIGDKSDAYVTVNMFTPDIPSHHRTIDTQPFFTDTGWGYSRLSHARGFINIHHLDENGRMAGTFEFKAWSDVYPELDTVRVTDGRFDL